MGRARDKRDVYYRRAKEAGYRARSAFKLLQVDADYHLIDPARTPHVVDLCAAPGSWSQVLSARLDAANRSDVRIVAVDLQDMAPLPGVIQLKGDITRLETAQAIISNLGSQAELVVCDGAPDVTGMHDVDQYNQAQLLRSALSIALCVMAPGAAFVAKIFRGKDVGLLYSQLKVFFPQVAVVKPKSSRNSSIESFVVCQNFTPPPGFKPIMIAPSNTSTYQPNDMDPLLVPFVASGDLCAYDSDMTYRLARTGYVSAPTVQPPINPPHKLAAFVRDNGLDDKKE